MKYESCFRKNNFSAKVDDLETLLKTMYDEIKSQRALRTSLSSGALKTVSFKLGN